MALNITRLKEKIKKAWTEEMENENENDYLDKASCTEDVTGLKSITEAADASLLAW